MVAPVETHCYKQAGRLNILADVYLPSPDCWPAPALLWLHGGALVLGGRQMVAGEQLAAYLEAGFAVIAPDYRLAPETKLPDILLDLQDAAAWLRAGEAGPAVDPLRIALVGHSAGGFLALSLAARLQPRACAVVSFYGYGDITADWLSSPSTHYLRQPAVGRAEALQAIGGEAIAQAEAAARLPFYVHCRQSGTWAGMVCGSGANPSDFSPALHIPGDHPPTFLLHGETDSDVPSSQSVQMASALAAQGIEHSLLILPGLGHDFDQAGNGLNDPEVHAAFAQVLDFLKTHCSIRRDTRPR